MHLYRHMVALIDEITHRWHFHQTAVMALAELTNCLHRLISTKDGKRGWFDYF
jgi:hypothetical protein